MNKQPEQTAQTRNKIIDAFLDIAKKRGIDKTSISEVMKAAGFNRGTFYVYFSDISDLILQVENEIIADFHSHVSSIKDDISVSNFEQASLKVAQFLSVYDERIFFLLSGNGEPHFRYAIQEEANQLIDESAPEFSKLPFKEYMIASYISAVIGLMTYWHDTGRKVPIDKLVAQMENLWMNGIKNIS